MLKKLAEKLYPARRAAQTSGIQNVGKVTVQKPKL